LSDECNFLFLIFIDYGHYGALENIMEYLFAVYCQRILLIQHWGHCFRQCMLLHGV